MAVAMSAAQQGSREDSLPRNCDVIVIGGGQCGLAVGYFLARSGLRFIILDERDRVGDIWRSRWDSMRLFTPARQDGLPGMRFPAPPHTYPTRDQMADFLEAYTVKWSLPVLTGVRVDGLWPAGDGVDGYVVTAGDQRFTAPQVVVATGFQGRPRMPAFSGQLDPAIRQLHSRDYRSPADLQAGEVLVVGAGNSGAEIALEAARDHPTTLAGPDVGQFPFRIDSWQARVMFRLMTFATKRILTVDTPIGRKMATKIRAGHAAPLARVKSDDLLAAGVERTFSRVVGARDGYPVLDDGRTIRAANVVWCTGFRLDFSWIYFPVLGENGYPQQDRGVVPSAPGLYFIGLPFLYSFGSMVIVGVGRDAEYIAKRIVARARTERKALATA